MDRNLEEETYSVLMAVYEKENPAFLRQSIESMLRQTLPFTDFVLVCDGPLTDGLEGVIRWAKKRMGAVLQVIRIPENRGLGNALRIGVLKCRCNVIARMDSDDISRTDRCERQYNVLKQGDYAIVSGTLQEFSKTPGDRRSCRELPRTSGEIRRYAATRNPFNHPCVMFRKDAVIKAGNYRSFPGFEDYYLWVRMLLKGFEGYNVQEIVLDMRTGNGMYSRRGGLEYVGQLLKFQRWLLDKGFISKKQFLHNCSVRLAVSLIPRDAREKVYSIFLRV